MGAPTKPTLRVHAFTISVDGCGAGAGIFDAFQFLKPPSANFPGMPLCLE
jgi:hypothetical protein